MNESLRISYETMGASSYVTAFFPPSADIVHYQLEMLLSNNIKNLLAASRQLMDGEMVIYYNITSRIPLSQVLEKRKLKRKELINLIEGVITAIRDASAYRLPAEGILLEPEYIYVNPASCAPEFLYLPVEHASRWGLKDLLSHLIMHDKVEMSNDNLIQVLLKELNSQPFSLDRLEKSLKSYQKEKTEQQKAASIPPQPMAFEYEYAQNSQPMLQQPIHKQQDYPAFSDEKAPENIADSMEKKKQQADRKSVKVPSVPKEKTKRKAGKRAEKSDEIRENDEGQENEWDPEKAKKMFLLPQALVMVIVAGCVSFGVFVDEAGQIVVNNILAVVIVIVLAEVILYREIYVNRKGKKTEGKKKPEKGKKQGKDRTPADPKPPIPGKKPMTEAASQQNPVLRTAPQAEPPQPSFAPQAEPPQPSFVQQPELRQSPALLPEYRQQGTPGFPSQQQSSGFGPQAVRQPIPPSSGNAGWGTAGAYYGMAPEHKDDFYEADTDLGGETELWEDMSAAGATAYLEYYENNNLIKIPLNSPAGVVIGRLESQVDFVVKNAKVGKVHAKVFCRDHQYFVVDINSKNGTYINGNRQRIESNIPYPLHDKDRITLADAEFTIRCAEN